MASKKVTEGNSEAMVYIGKREQPVAIIKRKEIAGFLTEEFWSYYSIWSDFNAGLGLPFGEGTAKYPDSFIAVIKAFTFQWRSVSEHTQ